MMVRSGSVRRCRRCSRKPKSNGVGSTMAVNVLAALPKSAHPAMTRVMQDIFNAEDSDHARVAAKAFGVAYGTKFPKAAAKFTDNLDVLL